MLYNTQKHIIFAITLLLGLTVQGEDIVAKVINAEASDMCSNMERILVASVINNRIGHKGFYSLDNAEQVVTYPNAFTAYGDTNNMNWNSSYISEHAKSLSKSIKNGAFKGMKGIHFFVTKGTKLPSHYYSKKYWKINKTVHTKHFTFYGIIARK
jgi:spore germination cell wall hydrolase CwlJ-like protein